MIKVEEPQLAAAGALSRQDVVLQPQHPRDIKTVLVKEEGTLVLHEVQAASGSRRMRWNVEPVNVENTSSPCKCCSRRSTNMTGLLHLVDHPIPQLHRSNILLST